MTVDEQATATEAEDMTAPALDEDGNEKIVASWNVGDKAPRKARQKREIDQKPEFRISVPRVELRATQDASTGNVNVEGTVIVYGVPYEVNDMFGSFTETIHAGACTELLESPDLDVRFLFNHAGMPLARTTANSLQLNEDDEGLHIKAQIDPRMSLANDLSVAIERGDISQMSIGMQVDPTGDNWSGEDEYGMPNVRNIYRLANVFDASAVTFPASTTTSIGLARSAWENAPTESRERLRKMWHIAKDIRAGRPVSQADGDALAHVIESLHEVDGDEGRADATPQDAKVADQITKVGHAIADLKASQAADPDHNTDPDDKNVNKKIAALSAAHDDLVAAQAKDGNPDAPAEEDDRDDNEVATDPDGTQSTGAGLDGNGNFDNSDGTGGAGRSADQIARERRAQIDIDLMELRKDFA